MNFLRDTLSIANSITTSITRSSIILVVNKNYKLKLKVSPMDDFEDKEIEVEELVDHLLDNPDTLATFVENILTEVMIMQDFMEFNGYKREDYAAWRKDMERRSLH